MTYMSELAAEVRSSGLVTWQSNDSGGGHYSRLTLARLGVGVTRRAAPRLHQSGEIIADLRVEGWYGKLTRAQCAAVRAFIAEHAVMAEVVS